MSGPIRWRVGSRVPLNVYEGDRSVCQCHNPEDARRIVDAVNRATFLGHTWKNAACYYCGVIWTPGEERRVCRGAPA